MTSCRNRLAIRAKHHGWLIRSSLTRFKFARRALFTILHLAEQYVNVIIIVYKIENVCLDF